MTTTERIEKTEALNDCLFGIELVLEELHNSQWPSMGLRTAIIHVKRAQNEVQKELSKLKASKSE